MDNNLTGYSDFMKNFRTKFIGKIGILQNKSGPAFHVLLPDPISIIMFIMEHSTITRRTVEERNDAL